MLESYIEVLCGCIQVLVYVYDQVICDENGGLLCDLLCVEFGFYFVKCEGIYLIGFNVVLDLWVFFVMVLVLYEMVMNVVKYGVLLQCGGVLLVSWMILLCGDCQICWQEIGVLGVCVFEIMGFGLDLICRFLFFDLGGESELSFVLDGLLVQFCLFVCFVCVLFDIGVFEEIVLFVVLFGLFGMLEGCCVFLVEDQVLIVMLLEVELIDYGMVVLGVVFSVKKVLVMIEQDVLDLVVLDLNLWYEILVLIVEVLMVCGIFFVFVIGYGCDIDLFDSFDVVLVVQKFYQVQDILKVFCVF